MYLDPSSTETLIHSLYSFEHLYKRKKDSLYPQILTREAQEASTRTKNTSRAHMCRRKNRRDHMWEIEMRWKEPSMEVKLVAWSAQYYHRSYWYWLDLEFLHLWAVFDSEKERQT